MQKSKITIILALLALTLLLLPACTKIKVTVIPSTEQDVFKLKIIQPANGEILPSDKARITFEPTNFKIGQEANIHVIIDNGPVLTHKSNDAFYISSLTEGRHVIRAFPAKRWGESIKDPTAFAISQFYIKTNNTPLLNTNLPILTYNEPAGIYKGEKAKRILLDFIITNAQLSKDGYKIEYKINNKTHELTSNSPIYLTNLQPGTHKITLQLLDKNRNLAEGIFTKTEREFTILPDKTTK